MKRNLLAFVFFAVAVPVLATTINATPPFVGGGTGAAPVADSAAAATATADDSSGLRNGTVEAVSIGGGTFHVYGQRLTFDTQRVKVFGKDGRASSIYTLRAGAKVRFTMDPADPTHRRVAVIYLD